MAKANISDYFTVEIDVFLNLSPDVKSRPMLFRLYVYLPLNEHIVALTNPGDLIDTTLLQSIVKKGLKQLYIANADKFSYEIYFKDTPTIEATPPTKQVQEVKSAPVLEATPPPKPQPAPQSPSIEPAQKVAPEPVSEEPKLEFSAPPSIKETTTVSGEKQTEVAAVEIGPEFVPELPPEQLMKGLVDGSAEEQKTAFEKSKDMVRTILEGTEHLDESIKKFVDDPMAEHATAVAIYSVLFAMGLKRTKKEVLSDLVISSLLHDIGITQLPPEVVTIPEANRSAQEKLIFEKHVNAGISLLDELDYKPNPRVITILSQHHERFNGTGYPNHIESFKVDDLAQVLELADLLDSITRGFHDGVEKSLSEALFIVSEIEKQASFPVYFNPDLLKKMLKWIREGGGTDYLSKATNTVQETKDKLLKTA